MIIPERVQEHTGIHARGHVSWSMMDRGRAVVKRGRLYNWDSMVAVKRVDNGTSWLEIDIPREMAAMLGVGNGDHVRWTLGRVESATVKRWDGAMPPARRSPSPRKSPRDSQ